MQRLAWAAEEAAGTVGPGGVAPAPAPGCDPLAPTYCGFPYPNDYWTVDDPTTATGKLLALPEVIMPENSDGIRATQGPFNEADGFSPGIAGDDPHAGSHHCRPRDPRHD